LLEEPRGSPRGFISCVGIYGLIKVKIVFQHYAGASSLYIQEGRQDGGRKTAPASRCSGTQSCPDATSGPSSPDAHYSDKLKKAHARTGQYLQWVKDRHPLNAGGARALHRRENTFSRGARSGRDSRWFCGRECRGRRPRGGRAGGKSGILSRMGGVVKRCWISLLLRTWGGWCLLRKKTSTRGAMRRSRREREEGARERAGSGAGAGAGAGAAGGPRRSREPRRN